MALLNALQGSLYRALLTHYCERLGVTVSEFAHTAGLYPEEVNNFYASHTNELSDAALHALSPFINDLSMGEELDVSAHKARGGEAVRTGADIAVEFMKLNQQGVQQ